MGAQATTTPARADAPNEALKAHLDLLLARHGRGAQLAQELTSSIKLETIRTSELRGEPLALESTPVSVPVSVSQVEREGAFGLRPSQASLSFEPDFQLGHGVPRADFALLDTLGEGGMGKVYLGSQASLGREVALKVSKADPNDPSQLAQVYHEAQITAALDHPNILPLYMLAQDEQGRPVQVMKRIQGTTWADLIEEPQHELWADLLTSAEDSHLHVHLELLAQVSLAVAYAHDRGVIHRDLKPENVMIGRLGEVYVLDWGVAISLRDLERPREERVFIAQERCGLATLLVGTPVYMAPEMGRPERGQLSTSADVYLLGAILYELLCGHPIRLGDDINVIFDMIMRGDEPPIPAHLSEEFKTLLQVSLCADPSQRLSDAQSFRRLLIHATRTDRADQLRQRADESRVALGQLLAGDPLRDEGALFDLYDEARLDYRSSLEMWPSSTLARSGLDLLHSLFTEYLIRDGELDVARRTIAKLSEPNPILMSQLEVAEQSRAHERAQHAKLRRWHRHNDIQQSHPLRVIVSVVGLVVFGFGALILELLQGWGALEVSPKGEVMISLILSLIAFLAIGVFTLKRRQVLREANLVFSRFVGYLALISMIAAFQRYVSWQIGLSSAQLLLQEMSLIALGCFGLSAIAGQQHFIVGGVGFVIAAIASVLFPWLTKGAYAVAMIVVWLSALLWTKSERDAPSTR